MGEAPLEQFAASEQFAVSEQRPVRFLLIAITVCLLLQAWLATRLEINWDEFFYLSHIYDYQRGEMTITLQVLHVHFLGWITALPGIEIDQIIYGRFVMLAFLAGTCGLIYALARTFFSPVASAMAVLTFVTAGPTLIHGASFRADPSSALLTMLSLVIVARARMSLWTALLAGACAALAAMVTIKVVLYAPAFLGVGLWRLRDKERRIAALKWLAGAALVAVAIFGLLYLMQLMLVEQARSSSATRAGLSHTARVTLFEAGLLPRWQYIFRAMWISPVQTVLLTAGAAGVLLSLVRSSGTERIRLLAILSCAGPLLCLLFYRNAFPYFYPFIFPPAMLLVAWVIDWSALLRRPLGLGLLGAVLVGLAIFVGKVWSERFVPPQRQLVDAVHRIFPDPVVAIDKCHMIGSFPKRGLFMSTWGMASYRRGKPIFEEKLRHDTVPLLLVNGIELADAVGAPETPELPPERRLLDEDRAILRDNYIEHWGAIWVAGKRLKPGETEFSILVPGTYTLEGDGVIINGNPIQAGAVIDLSRGRHRISAPIRSASVLRWGNHLERPAEEPLEGPIFLGF